MIGSQASVARPLTRRRPMWRTVLVVAAVGAAGYLVGAVTSPAQGFLPEAVQSVANSSSGWTLLAFALVWLSRLRPGAAAISGALAFVLMVEGYRFVSDLRGFPNGPPFYDVFTIAGLVVGPIIGASAALLRYGSPTWRALAIAPLPAVLIGEGAYGLTVIANSTSPVYWWIAIGIGAAFTVGQLVRQRPRPLLATSVVVLVALGAVVFWIVYRMPLTTMLPSSSL